METLDQLKAAEKDLQTKKKEASLLIQGAKKKRFRVAGRTVDKIRKMLAENKKFKANKIIQGLPCSKAVTELAAQTGGYICRNCHSVIHERISKTESHAHVPRRVTGTSDTKP